MLSTSLILALEGSVILAIFLCGNIAISNRSVPLGNKQFYDPQQQLTLSWSRCYCLVSAVRSMNV